MHLTWRKYQLAKARIEGTPGPKGSYPASSSYVETEGDFPMDWVAERNSVTLLRAPRKFKREAERTMSCR